MHASLAWLVPDQPNSKQETIMTVSASSSSSPFDRLPARSGPRGPLSGVRVLDLSAYIAGPYGCTLLADQGADVIKIESPDGDNLRKYPSTLELESRAFLGVNRSKHGIVLDLKQAEGLAALLELVKEADVLVHNFRPSVPPRLGIAYEQLQAVNPRLIYCAVTGYGDTGPLCGNAGYDQVLQTMTGMCSMQGKHGGPPEIVYGSVVDYYAAAMVSSGVASALYERERSGIGQYVGVSLLRSALAMQSARLVWAEGEPRERQRDMRSGGVTGIHPTRDGHIYISANTPRFWQSLCEKTGLLDLLRNERYDTVKKRAQHVDEVMPRLHDALQAHSALEWERIFGQDVPCAAAREIEDMFDHPQVVAEELMTTFDHPVVGSYRGFTQPIKFGRTPGPQSFSAPAFGQHSDALLGESESQANHKST
jgi:formyl-CoA transferase